MEWLDRISGWVDSLQEELKAHPEYGYLVVAGLLLLWLVGIVCGWKWTYARPGSWNGNFWLETLGEKTYRFWLGAIVFAAAGLSVTMFFLNGPSGEGV